MSEPPDRRFAALAALAFILALVVGGLWLQQHMRANGLLEDCLMAGRRNCAPVPAAN